jgi:peptidoglycan/LPS O-acetylase OafA/YrhL
VQPKKLDFIDALRGVAALYVLIYHLSLITQPNAIAPQWIRPLTGSGGSGVMLFFALSAFTLCMSMRTRGVDEETPVLNYFIRRFFRIAPLFYVWMIITFIRDVLLFHVWQSPAEVLRSALFIFNFIPGHEQGYVWASWTIGVEMAFYVLFPIAFRIADNLGKAVALFFGALLLRMIWFSVSHRVWAASPDLESFYQISLLHHLPNFLLGIVAFHVYRVINVDAARRHGVGYALIAASAASYVGMVYGGISFAAFGDTTTIQTFIYSVLLLGASISAPKILVNRVTRFMGRISYSIYLGHATIIFLMSGIFAAIYRGITNIEIAYFISVIVAIGVVAPISYLTYRLIEVPGNRLGRDVIAFLTFRSNKKSHRRITADR